MPLKIEPRAMRSIFVEDGKKKLVVRGTIILILSLVAYITLVESGIMLAVRNVIILLTLIWMVSKVEELKNRR